MLFVALMLAGCTKEEAKSDVYTGPEGELALTNPAPGAFVQDGVFTASGTAKNLTDLKVMGQGAKHDGTGFTARVQLDRGIDVVEASGVDGHGDTLFVRNGVLAGEFASPEGSIEDALQLRVNQSGLDKMGDLVTGMLDEDTINSGVSGMNPVLNEDYGYGTHATADVSSIEFAPVQIDIQPGNDRVVLVADIPDLVVSINTYGEALWIDFDTDIFLYADDAVVTAELTVDARNGKLVVDLSGAVVELQGFSYDTSLLPGDIESYLFVETIRTTIENMLVEKITEMVPPLLDSTLSGLDPSFSTELLGLQVDLAFSFADAGSDRDGLTLDLDLDIAVPDAGTHSAPGYLSAGDGTPDINTHTDVAGAISDDLLNKVLYEAWTGGLLDLKLSTDDGSLPAAMLLSFKAEQGAITVDPQLPPVIVEKDGGLVAEVGELVVTVDTPGGELGEHLVVAVNAEVPLDVKIEDGEIVLDLGTPTLTMMVRESDWGASDERVTNLISEMLPLDSLLTLLGGFSFPVPTLYGISLDSGEAYRDEDGVHTGLDVYLK